MFPVQWLISPSVAIPPTFPVCSISITFAPSLAAQTAAENPAGPAPNTSTSTSSAIGIDFAFSS